MRPVSTIENNLRLPGQYYDRETGLHYNYFRDYDPTTGRYIEADPIGFDAGPNLYAYVDGNPITRTDWFGLFCGSGWNEVFVPDSFPGGVDFSSACHKHDICYSECGTTKSACDESLLSDALAECEKFPQNSIVRNQCVATATWYWEAVGRWGRGAFDNAQRSCSCKQ